MAEILPIWRKSISNQSINQVYVTNDFSDDYLKVTSSTPPPLKSVRSLVLGLITSDIGNNPDYNQGYISKGKELSTLTQKPIFASR